MYKSQYTKIIDSLKIHDFHTIYETMYEDKNILRTV